MKYNSKDVSIVIPTYNRVKDVRILLDSIIKLKNKPLEVIIVDQSTDDKTKNLCGHYKIVRYIKSNPPSITIARNCGIRNSNKKTKVVLFLDDDVILNEDYLEKILEVYNKFKTAKGVAAFWSARGLLNFNNWPFYKKVIFYVQQSIKKLFFLGYFEKKRIRITGPFGNTYAISSGKILNAEWLKGMNMSYKKEVFNKIKFDENLLGYTVVEDISFSCVLNKIFPNSLYITPFAKIQHRFSQTERHNIKKMMFINLIDHFYLFYKMFNKTTTDKLKFLWSLFGIILLRFLSLLTFNSENYKKLVYFNLALFYCIKNKDIIKKGRLREF